MTTSAAATEAAAQDGGHASGGGRDLASRTAFPTLVVLSALVQGMVHATRLVASYRALELNATALELGLVAASYAVLSLAAAVWIGRLVDRHGEPRFIMVGAALLGIGSVTAVTAGEIWLLILSQAALGMGQLMSSVAQQTLVGAHSDARTRSARFGYYSAGGSIGQLAGPLLGATIVASATGVSLPGQLAFLVLSLTMASLGVWLFRVERSRAEARLASEESGERHSAWRILRWPGMPLAMLSSIAINLGGDVLIVFMPAYAESIGLPVAVVGVLLALRGAAAVVIRFVMGTIVARLGPDLTLLTAVTTSALAMIAIPLTRSPELLGVVMIVLGIGLGLGQPMTLSWVSAAAPLGSRGTAMALRISGNRFGQIFAPIILGAIAGPAGVAAVFVALAGLLGTVAVLHVRTPLPRDVT